MLIGAGANIDFAIATGCTPLFIASEHGHTDVVKALLIAKASWDSVTTSEYEKAFSFGLVLALTPLYVACQHGHAQIVELLLLARASLDMPAENDNRETPLSIAHKGGYNTTT